MIRAGWTGGRRVRGSETRALGLEELATRLPRSPGAIPPARAFPWVQQAEHIPVRSFHPWCTFTMFFRSSSSAEFVGKLRIPASGATILQPARCRPASGPRAGR